LLDSHEDTKAQRIKRYRKIMEVTEKQFDKLSEKEELIASQIIKQGIKRIIL